MKLHAKTLVVALALAPAFSFASEKKAEDAKMNDERLVTILHNTNQEEIAAGKLAQEKGTSADVKNLGERLVADHTKADGDVMAAADKAGVKPNPSSLSTHDKQMEQTDKKKMDQMKKLSGSEFDKAFAQEMSRDHDHMISMLKDAKSHVSPPIRELVDNTIPVLKQHKDLADKASKSADRGTSQGRAPEPVKR
jgi:putative membrane protein